MKRVVCQWISVTLFFFLHFANTYWHKLRPKKTLNYRYLRFIFMQKDTAHQAIFLRRLYQSTVGNIFVEIVEPILGFSMHRGIHIYTRIAAQTLNPCIQEAIDSTMQTRTYTLSLYLFVSLIACLFVYLSVSLSAYLSLSLSLSICICICLQLSTCLSFICLLSPSLYHHLFICLSAVFLYPLRCLFASVYICLIVFLSILFHVKLSVWLFIYLSVYLSLCLFPHLSVYLPICLFACSFFSLSILLPVFLAFYFSI